MIRNFLKDDSGNFAFIVAFMSMPILILVAGAIDTNRHTRVQGVMQRSADAAVLAAFRQSKPNWRNRQRSAHRHFMLNARNVEFVNGVKMRMTRKVEKKHLVYTYQASTKVDKLFGDLSPFSGQEITVQARAAQRMGTRDDARLVGNDNTQGQQGRQGKP